MLLLQTGCSKYVGFYGQDERGYIDITVVCETKEMMGQDNKALNEFVERFIIII